MGALLPKWAIIFSTFTSLPVLGVGFFSCTVEVLSNWFDHLCFLQQQLDVYLGRVQTRAVESGALLSEYSESSSVNAYLILCSQSGRSCLK